MEIICTVLVVEDQPLKKDGFRKVLEATLPFEALGAHVAVRFWNLKRKGKIKLVERKHPARTGRASNGG